MPNPTPPLSAPLLLSVHICPIRVLLLYSRTFTAQLDSNLRSVWGTPVRDLVLGGLVHLAVGDTVAIHLKDGVPAKDGLPPGRHNLARGLPDKHLWLHPWTCMSSTSRVLHGYYPLSSRWCQIRNLSPASCSCNCICNAHTDPDTKPVQHTHPAESCHHCFSKRGESSRRTRSSDSFKQ